MQALYHNQSLNASFLGYNFLIRKITGGDIVYDLGALIKTHRKERRITQKKLGEMLGVSEGTISKYEANVSLPPFETLRSIASIFNISMDTLYGMKHQGTLSTHGLTSAQTDTLKALADVYRSKNIEVNKQSVQQQFTILGKIAAELTK